MPAHPVQTCIIEINLSKVKGGGGGGGGVADQTAVKVTETEAEALLNMTDPNSRQDCENYNHAYLL